MRLSSFVLAIILCTQVVYGGKLAVNVTLDADTKKAKAVIQGIGNLVCDGKSQDNDIFDVDEKTKKISLEITGWDEAPNGMYAGTNSGKVAKAEIDLGDTVGNIDKKYSGVYWTVHVGYDDNNKLTWWFRQQTSTLKKGTFTESADDYPWNDCFKFTSGFIGILLCSFFWISKK
jgi:hypothetical protein